MKLSSALVGSRKPVVHERHELFEEEIAEVISIGELRMVGEITVETAGHHHYHFAVLGEARQAGVTDPVVPVTHAGVQQPQHLVLLAQFVELPWVSGRLGTRDKDDEVSRAGQYSALQIDAVLRHQTPPRHISITFMLPGDASHCSRSGARIGHRRLRF